VLPQDQRHVHEIARFPAILPCVGLQRQWTPPTLWYCRFAPGDASRNRGLFKGRDNPIRSSVRTLHLALRSALSLHSSFQYNIPVRFGVLGSPLMRLSPQSPPGFSCPTPWALPQSQPRRTAQKSEIHHCPLLGRLPMQYIHCNLVHGKHAVPRF
jgi:hypothetical protein